jgi:uncharacterized NAD-dependent epimerase/dehydratase family protein
VLQHAPGRRFFDGAEDFGVRIPPVEDEIELIGRYGARVLGVALNGEHLDDESLFAEAARVRALVGVPVSLPLHDRAEPLLDAVVEFARR